LNGKGREIFERRHHEIDEGDQRTIAN